MTKPGPPREAGLRVDQTSGQDWLPYTPTLVTTLAISARALPLMPA